MKFGGTSVADADAIGRLRRRSSRAEHRRRRAARAGRRRVGAGAASPTGCSGRPRAARSGRRRLPRRESSQRAARSATWTCCRGADGASAARALLAERRARQFDELERARPRARGARARCRRARCDAIAADRRARSAAASSRRRCRRAASPARWVDARRADRDRRRAHGRGARHGGDRRRALRATVVAAARRSGTVAVLGGFVGATRAGVTTTLGRGGSDYSAAIVGACLDVDEIQIWTDVDGMLTADPRIVAEPRRGAAAVVRRGVGARVLRREGAAPGTILPAVAKNIPVRILNSRRPENRRHADHGRRAPATRPLTAIACKRGVTVVDITSTRMLMAHGFLRRLFEVFERFKTPVDVVTTSEVSVSVTVDDTRRLDGDRRRPARLRRGRAASTRWRSSARSARICGDPTLFAAR